MGRIPVVAGYPQTVSATAEDQRRVISQSGTILYSSPSLSGSLSAGSSVVVSENTTLSIASGRGYAVVLDVVGQMDNAERQNPDQSWSPYAQDTYNVKHFGAIGDGSTHPLSQRFSTLAQAQTVYSFATTLNMQIDYCAIQKAINTASAAGAGTVFLPRGVYLTTDSIALASGVRLRGPAANYKDTTKGAVIQVATSGAMAATPVIDASGAVFSGVHDICLLTAGPYATSNTTLGISDATSPATFFTIERCTFRYFGGTVIKLTGGVNYVLYNRADDSNSNFIHLYNDGGSGHASDCMIIGNESGAAANTGEFGAGANGDALLLEGNANCLIAFNQLYNFRYGINATGCTNHRFVGNRLEKHDLAGVYLQNNTVDCELVGNSGFNNGWISGAKTGLLISGSHRIVARGNKWFNYAGAPGGGTSSSSMDGNQAKGVLVTSSSTDCDVDDYVYNTTTIGIHVDGGSGHKIAGYVNNVGEEGVYVGNDATDTHVTTKIKKVSQVTDNTKDAVVVTGTNSDRNRIEAFVRHASATKKARYAVNINGGNNNVIGGDIQSSANQSPAIRDVGTGTIYGRIVGYTSQAKGTGTIANGSTSVTVTHGLSFTPTAGDIAVTATNNLGNAAQLWVSNIGATTFDVNSDADPGATTATFAWRAERT